jgi:predicted DCC family thiol-disulfide oxidoreductase YuxK
MATGKSVENSMGPNETASDLNRKTIVYFDGVCSLCNHFVDLLLRLDRADRLRFAPLQGQTAFKRLPPSDTVNLGSLVVSKGDRVYRESNAVVQILLELGRYKFLGYLLKMIPEFARDTAYRFVARHRYQIWGKKETCRIPTPEERAHFVV